MIDDRWMDVILAQWQHRTCDSAWPHASMMDSCIQLCLHNGSTELETARGLMHRLSTRAINYARTMEAQSLQQRVASCIDYRFVHSDSSRTMAAQSLRQRVASCIAYRLVHSVMLAQWKHRTCNSAWLHASTIGSCMLIVLARWQHRA